MKQKITLFVLVVLTVSSVSGQTLQQVTDIGAITTNSIWARSYFSFGGSFAGASLPNNISSLLGLQISGDIPDDSHNGLTYSSGGGGGAAISFYRGRSYDTGIDFYTNYNTPITGNLIHALRIDNLGHLGIGTIAPRAFVDVAKFMGNGQLGTVFGRLAEGDAVGEGTFLGVRGHGTDMLDGKSFSLVHGFYGQANSSISFHRGQSTTGGFISFATSSDVERMRIDRNGNVGIGTANPAEKLAVNGKVRAREVKVEPVTGWPDYVFEESYKPRKLKEIEHFIKINKHLPEVPSANEVAKNGIELGEMNRILLKKVEELTLHLIEKEKELKATNARIDQLSEIVKQLVSTQADKK